jgi:hypothetical protein
MITPNEHNGEEPRRFFRSLYGEGAPGYLPIWTRQDRLTRWVPANDLDLAAQTARLLGQTKDVYFGVGLQPRDLGQSQRGQAKDVIAIPGCWADVDVRGPAHKGTDLPPTKDDARTLLGEFPLEPTLVVDSAHGLQPWWLFKEPWVFDGDEERQRPSLMVREPTDTRKPPSSHTRTVSSATLFAWEGIIFMRTLSLVEAKGSVGAYGALQSY